ncbi:unnamed protein product [Hapterophycus canaliculatus]
MTHSVSAKRKRGVIREKSRVTWQAALCREESASLWMRPSIIERERDICSSGGKLGHTIHESWHTSTRLASLQNHIMRVVTFDALVTDFVPSKGRVPVSLKRVFRASCTGISSSIKTSLFSA